MSIESRLVLGTAQLGMPYGIANTTGQPDLSQARDIIRTGWENGIHQFDTAQAYASSESVLGLALQELGLTNEAKIITKPHPNLDHLKPEALSRAVESSLYRLKVPSLYCLMLHSESFLDILDRGLKDILFNITYVGHAKYIGVSVYSPEKALQAINSDVIDFIQLPTNVLDRRFEKAGVFNLAVAKKKKIYIRSVFLQGLILMRESEIPESLEFAKPALKILDKLAKEFGMARQEMALGYVKQKFAHAKIVFGAETPKQVSDTVSAWMADAMNSIPNKLEESFSSVDERILNPSLWSC